MTTQDALSPEGKAKIERLTQHILAFEPVLNEFIRRGYPFEEHWNTLQERKRWNQLNREMFLSTPVGTPREST